MASTQDYMGAPSMVRDWMAGSGHGRRYTLEETRELARDTLSLVQKGFGIMRQEKRAKARQKRQAKSE